MTMKMSTIGQEKPYPEHTLREQDRLRTKPGGRRRKFAEEFRLEVAIIPLYEWWRRAISRDSHVSFRSRGCAWPLAAIFSDKA